MTRRDPLFELAEDRADILDVASGLTLYRAGRTVRGACPINGCGSKKKADGPFWVDQGRQRFGCFNCECQKEIGGDAVALEHALNSRGGETIRHAAARLAGVDLDQWNAEQKAKDDAYAPVQGVIGAPSTRSGVPPSPEDLQRRRERDARRASQAVSDADRDAWIAALAARLWGEAQPAPGTPVELYLRARGLVGRPLDLALRQLRFHPAAYHSGREEKAVRMPAMIGLIVAPLGLMAQPTGGVHVTYLAEGGDLVWGKARVERAKTVWGPPKLDVAARSEGSAFSTRRTAEADPRSSRPQGGSAQRWGGVWLTPPGGAGPLIVGEGIESVLSAAVLAGEPVRAVAALSLGALQGGWLSDAYGRFDADAPKADPEAPAFTWPEPESAPWGQVRICVDRDMKTIEKKARRAGGGTWKRPLDGEARARVCGALARQNWERVMMLSPGANGVRIWAPAPGRDFNDELRARTSAGQAFDLGRGQKASPSRPDAASEERAA